MIQFYNQFTGERIEATTDEYGRYTLANLAAPEHGVEVNMSAKTDFDGWRAELGSHPRRVFDGQEVADVNFTLVRNTSSISGTVFAKDGVWHLSRIRSVLSDLLSDIGRPETQEAWKNVYTEEMEPLGGVRVVLAYPRRNRQAGAMIAETVSGDDGGYMFQHVAPGPRLVYVAPLKRSGQSVPEDLIEDSESLTVEDGEHWDGVDLSIGIDAVAVSGRIIDREGNPIAYAKVSAEPLHISRPSGDGGQRIRTHAIRTVADADGHFRIDGLTPATLPEVTGFMFTGTSLPYDGRTYRIVARAPGYAPAHVVVPSMHGEIVWFVTALFEEVLRAPDIDIDEFDLTRAADHMPNIRDNDITGIDIVLDSGAAIAGLVQDTQGNLLPDVRVRLSFAEKPPWVPTALVQSASAPEWVTTDADAFFRFSPVPTGEYFFEVDNGAGGQRARNEPLLVNAGENFADLVVVVEAEAERGNIEGKVFTSVSGLRVKEFSLQMTGIESPPEPSPRWGNLTLNKEEGAFTIEGVSPGRLSFALDAPGYARENLEVEVKPEETASLHIVLAPEGVLHGHIYLNGEPGGAQIVYGPNGSSGYIQTDENGYYEKRGMKAGSYLVTYTVGLYEHEHGSAWLAERRWVEVVAGQATEVDIDYRGGCVIQGTFDGVRGEKWLVRVFDDTLPGDNKLRAGARIRNEHGRYEIFGLPAGTYAVVGVSRNDDGREVEQSRSVTIDEGEIVTIDFAL